MMLTLWQRVVPAYQKALQEIFKRKDVLMVYPVNFLKIVLISTTQKVCLIENEEK